MDKEATEKKFGDGGWRVATVPPPVSSANATRYERSYRLSFQRLHVAHKSNNIGWTVGVGKEYVRISFSSCVTAMNRRRLMKLSRYTTDAGVSAIGGFLCQ